SWSTIPYLWWYAILRASGNQRRTGLHAFDGQP
ncbi:uvrD/REP helicase N-terminal domain protein, partial [Vibrio parahaemolyticus AQ3810]